MLVYVLAIAIALGSLAYYLIAFFLPEVHRRQDFIWSGVGLFYALVLWVCGDRMTGAVLLGQGASGALVLWLGWQTLSLRWALTPPSLRTPITWAMVNARLTAWRQSLSGTGTRSLVADWLAALTPLRTTLTNLGQRLPTAKLRTALTTLGAALLAILGTAIAIVPKALTSLGKPKPSRPLITIPPRSPISPPQAPASQVPGSVAEAQDLESALADPEAIAPAPTASAHETTNWAAAEPSPPPAPETNWPAPEPTLAEPERRWPTVNPVAATPESNWPLETTETDTTSVISEEVDSESGGNGLEQATAPDFDSNWPLD